MQQNDEYIMKIVVARNMLNNSKSIIVYYINSLFICEIFTSRQVFKIKVEYIAIYVYA